MPSIHTQQYTLRSAATQSSLASSACGKGAPRHTVHTHLELCTKSHSHAQSIYSKNSPQYGKKSHTQSTPRTPHEVAQPHTANLQKEIPAVPHNNTHSIHAQHTPRGIAVRNSQSTTSPLHNGAAWHKIASPAALSATTHRNTQLFHSQYLPQRCRLT